MLASFKSKSITKLTQVETVRLCPRRSQQCVAPLTPFHPPPSVFRSPIACTAVEAPADDVVGVDVVHTVPDVAVVDAAVLEDAADADAVVADDAEVTLGDAVVAAIVNRDVPAVDDTAEGAVVIGDTPVAATFDVAVAGSPVARFG